MAEIEISQIKIGPRQRVVNQAKVVELAESIRLIGLLHPISLGEDNQLVSGLHRLKAHQLLGCTTIEYRRVSLDAAQQRLAEIDENLQRAELNDIELGEHLLARDQLLAELGLLACSGDNRHTLAGRARLADLAKAMDLHVVSLFRKRRIARELASDVREALKTTPWATQTTGLLRLAKLSAAQQRQVVALLVSGGYRELKPAINAVLFSERKQAVVRSLAGYRRTTCERFQAISGDFRQRGAAVADDSLDLIWCDPPYAQPELYEDLAAFAARTLKPGAACLAYCGQHHLPGILAAMSRHLSYWWVLSLDLRHGRKGADHAKRVFIEWKPIVWFVKGELTPRQRYVGDGPVAVQPELGKRLHRWEQDTATPDYYIFNLTETDALVCDPMMGTGSTGVAALRAGRRFLGLERDAATCRLAEQRLRQCWAQLRAQPAYQPGRG